MSKIIYQNDNGTISVVHPGSAYSFADACEKDVPAGKDYLIIDDDAVPTDRTFREAWTADFSSPDGQGIGEAAWLAKQPAPETTDTTPIK